MLDWFAAHRAARRPARQASLVELYRLGIFGRNPHLRCARRILHHDTRVSRRAGRRPPISSSSLGDPIIASRYQARAQHVRIRTLLPMLERGAWPARRQSRPESIQPASEHSGRPLRRSSQRRISRKSCTRSSPSSPAQRPTACSAPPTTSASIWRARSIMPAWPTTTFNRSTPGASCCRFTSAPGPKSPGDTRSDSHAWSAHPIYDLLTLVAGIEPASPGFATVRVAPHLGSLHAVTANYPHPEGTITVEYHRNGTALDADVTCPASFPARLFSTASLAAQAWDQIIFRPPSVANFESQVWSRWLQS